MSAETNQHGETGIDTYAPMAYIPLMEIKPRQFIETDVFSEELGKFLSDDEYGLLQWHLVVNPEAGDLISGGKGLRKLRWSLPAQKKGKRGGLRVIYYLVARDSAIIMVFVYRKSAKTNLSKREIKILVSLLEG